MLSKGLTWPAGGLAGSEIGMAINLPYRVDRFEHFPVMDYLDYLLAQTWVRSQLFKIYYFENLPAESLSRQADFLLSANYYWLPSAYLRSKPPSM
jgi:hypothetical protein